jgi:Flp pilus assembly CpaE family ATPase
MEIDMKHTENSILIVTQNPAFAKNIGAFFPEGDDIHVATKASSFSAMNGSGGDLTFQNDIVIFDADPDNAEEVAAIADLLKLRADSTLFLALTGNDVSIAKAQKLREAGVDEVLPQSISAVELRSVIDNALKKTRDPYILGQQHQSGEVREGKVIAVSQARGGIGATTVFVNLAYSLLGQSGVFKKTAKHRVALVDLDLQFGNANVFLDLEDGGGMLRLIEATQAPDADFMKGAMLEHSSGLMVLSAPATIAPLHSLQPDKIHAMLDCLRQEYDCVVVDMPHAMVDWIEPVLKLSSRMLIVSDTSVPSIRHARRLIDFYKEDHVGLAVDVVINRESRPVIKSSHHREAGVALDTKLRYWLPNNAKVARKAVDFGHPIVAYSPNTDLGKALRKFATDLSTSVSAKKTKTA